MLELNFLFFRLKVFTWDLNWKASTLVDVKFTLLSRLFSTDMQNL